MTAAALLVLAYLVGSIPTSLWLGRACYRLDLREEGSGNLGATNAFRVLGWKAAIPVLAVDVGKGWLPVYLFPILAGRSEPLWALAYGAAAIAGHTFSFWVRFRGGKGIATSTGVFLALAPWALLIALGAWIAAVIFTRIVSVGSLLAVVVLPLAVAGTPHRGGEGMLWFTGALALFVLWTHRKNLARLIRGEENRIATRRGGVAS